MLANIYLHYVLDRWFEEVARPRLRRSAFLARFADDVVFAFEEKRDAERVLRALRKRLERYPFSITPAFSHLSIDRRITPSRTRCSRNVRR